MRTLIRLPRARPLIRSALPAGVLLLAPALLRAQSQLDLHGNFSVGTATHVHAWGAGAGFQSTFGSPTQALRVSLSPSLDYLKQQGTGSTQTSWSADIDVQPGGSSTVTPYTGVSAGANWSGGSTQQWEGVKLGMETLAGAQVKLSPRAPFKAEERFGYVVGQEHTLTTRAEVLLSF